MGGKKNEKPIGKHPIHSMTATFYSNQDEKN